MTLEQKLAEKLAARISAPIFPKNDRTHLEDVLEEALEEASERAAAHKERQMGTELRQTKEWLARAVEVMRKITTQSCSEKGCIRSGCVAEAKMWASNFLSEVRGK